MLPYLCYRATDLCIIALAIDLRHQPIQIIRAEFYRFRACRNVREQYNVLPSSRQVVMLSVPAPAAPDSNIGVIAARRSSDQLVSADRPEPPPCLSGRAHRPRVTPAHPSCVAVHGRPPAVFRCLVHTVPAISARHSGRDSCGPITAP